MSNLWTLELIYIIIYMLTICFINCIDVVATTTTTTAAPSTTISQSTTTTVATSTTKTATSTSATATAISTSTSVPSGNSTITSWVKKQQEISWGALLQNVNPAGSATGFIAASLSTSNPDYFYSWVRDSALVARVMTYMYNTTEAGNSTLLGLLQDYVSFQVKIMGESNVCDCLGEPKFNPVRY